MNENINFGMAMLLPGFGCWSQDQTTARLGNTNEGVDNPSIKSSLTFLRKTPWARKKVEELYING